MYVRVLMRGAARYRGSEQGKGRRGSGGKKKKKIMRPRFGDA
jgi:hypothetical protein